MSPLFVTFAHGILCAVCSVQAEDLVDDGRRRGGVCPRPHVPVLHQNMGRQSLNINSGGLNMAAIRGSNEPSQSFHSATVSRSALTATSTYMTIVASSPAQATHVHDHQNHSFGFPRPL